MLKLLVLTLAVCAIAAAKTPKPPVCDDPASIAARAGCVEDKVSALQLLHTLVNTQRCLDPSSWSEELPCSDKLATDLVADIRLCCIDRTKSECLHHAEHDTEPTGACAEPQCVSQTAAAVSSASKLHALFAACIASPARDTSDCVKFFKVSAQLLADLRKAVAIIRGSHVRCRHADFAFHDDGSFHLDL